MTGVSLLLGVALVSPVRFVSIFLYTFLLVVVKTYMPFANLNPRQNLIKSNLALSQMDHTTSLPMP